MINWMGIMFDKENIEMLNKYVERYMQYSQTSIEKALENYYRIAFNSLGFLTGTPFSFEAFKKFIDDNDILKVKNDVKKEKTDKPKESEDK